MTLERSARPLAQCWRCTRHDKLSTLPFRAFSQSTFSRQEATTETETHDALGAKSNLNPFNVVNARQERKLMQEQHQVPVGSRRKRAAVRSTQNIPFIELPYQCFQEARKVLQEYREEKLEAIANQRKRIEKLMDKVVVGDAEQAKKEHQLKSMRRHLEDLKIQADVNDPIVKKRFEDGQADMNKPIYRYYADKEWRAYKRRVLVQRITQMNVVPDVLPTIDPSVSTSLSFSPPGNVGRRRQVQHGDFVDSRVSEYAPDLKIQKFDKGEKLYTIAVINPDVPDVKKDAFDSRCHFLACNVPLSPTKTHVRFQELSPDSQIVLPWLPAYAQKGIPYQRMSIVILEQLPAESKLPGSGEEPPSQVLPLEKMKGKCAERKGFSLRALSSRFPMLKPVGVDLFRSQWDEGTAGVMKRAGIVGWDVEFKRKRIEPLPYKRLKGERYR